MEIAAAFLKFAVCSAIIIIAGTKLSKYGDVISEKTGLSGVWIGVVMMATATSLPELITGSSAIALVGAPDLALGDAFGSNLFNLLVIAMLDLVSRGRPILSQVRLAHIVSASLGILLIGTAVASIFLSTIFALPALGWVGIYSPLLVLLYIVGIRLVYTFEKRGVQRFLDKEAAVMRYEDLSLRLAVVGYLIAAAFIIGAGTWLAFVGEEIAHLTSLGTTFIGTLLLATTTSLPEAVVSMTALRLGARDMAVANMLGSNLFNMGIVLAVDDVVSINGPLMALVDVQHVFTGLIAIVMSAVVIVGVIFRSERTDRVALRWETVTLITIFLLGMYTLYLMQAFRPELRG